MKGSQGPTKVNKWMGSDGKHKGKGSREPLGPLLGHIGTLWSSFGAIVAANVYEQKHGVTHIFTRAPCSLLTFDSWGTADCSWPNL